jgi:multiple sugar transport system permease protein
MMALTIVTQDELRPLSVKLVTFIGFYRTEWGPAMAYSVVITLPMILLFAVLQRMMVGGLTAGFSK